MFYSALQFNTAVVATEDTEVADLIKKEQQRQENYIPLIPSENLVSAPVAAALSSPFTNKYAEGYPHLWKKGEKILGDGRYYQGQVNTNSLEELVINRALQLFTDNPAEYHANVQALSGSPANLAVLSAFLDKGDTFMGLSLDFGGHLTHGHKVSITSKFFNAVQYTLDENGVLDYDAVDKLAGECQPKLIICGATAYPLQIDFEKFATIAHKHNAVLVADISHIAGLCVTGQHPNPFPHADVVTTTTHKILRGPRAGLIICKKEFGAKIDKAVFPGCQGGPHMNTLAALAVALKEDLSPRYAEYAAQVVKNAKALAGALKENGWKLVSGGTENHLILIDVTGSGFTGVENGAILATAMEKAHLVANKNAIPKDDKPLIPSGVRLGTPAVTTLGMKEEEMKKIAGFITDVAKNINDENSLDLIAQQVVQFMRIFTQNDPLNNFL